MLAKALASRTGGKPRACGAQGCLKAPKLESALQKAANAATNLYELHDKNVAASFSDGKLLAFWISTIFRTLGFAFSMLRFGACPGIHLLH